MSIDRGLSDKIVFIRRFVGKIENITNGNIVQIAGTELRVMGISPTDLRLITKLLDLDYELAPGDIVSFWYDPL